MYLPAKFGGQRSYGNGDISSCVSCYMDTSGKAELTTLITILRLSLCNSEVSDTASRKARRGRRIHIIAKRYAFHLKAIIILCILRLKCLISIIFKSIKHCLL